MIKLNFMLISMFFHLFMAAFSLSFRKNNIVYLNPQNFRGHSEDFRPFLQIKRKTPKIGGAGRPGLWVITSLLFVVVNFNCVSEKHHVY